MENYLSTVNGNLDDFWYATRRMKNPNISNITTKDEESDEWESQRTYEKYDALVYVNDKGLQGALQFTKHYENEYSGGKSLNYSVVRKIEINKLYVNRKLFLYQFSKLTRRCLNKIYIF